MSGEEWHIYGCGPSLVASPLLHPSIGWNRTILHHQVQRLLMDDGKSILWSNPLSSLYRIKEAIFDKRPHVICQPDSDYWPGKTTTFRRMIQSEDDFNERLMDYRVIGQLSGVSNSCSETIHWVFQQNPKRINIYGMDFFGSYYCNGDMIKVDDWSLVKARTLWLIRILMRCWPGTEIVSHSPFMRNSELQTWIARDVGDFESFRVAIRSLMFPELEKGASDGSC